MGQTMKNQSKITMTSFDIGPGGEDIIQYTLENENGVRVSVINYGGIITNLYVPDRQGKINDIVLGYNRIKDYVNDSPYFGALIGRYGNRLAGGKFVLDGNEYQLALNDNPGGLPCHLHGGNQGFDKVIWDVEPILKEDLSGLKLYYKCDDGEEGYPGNMDISIYYYLTFDNTLRVEYYAETDRKTPVNLTQHSYFNLKGEGQGNILDHQLNIYADSYTPVNKGLIPTGEIELVKDTPFDFRTVKAIGQEINENNEQLDFGAGYDHNYVLNSGDGEFRKAAAVYEPESGREMEVWTSEPGVQFYSGNNLEESYIGKSGKPYKKYSGFCLETQHYPDSPNHNNFPSTILKPGEEYYTVTEFRFNIREE